MNNYSLFQPETKMAEVILRNYTLLSILPRFSIKLGFGESTIAKVCQESNVDIDFFLMVCNLHTFDGYTPSQQQLFSTNIKSLIEYLKRSHQYYINLRINSIERKLDMLASTCIPAHQKMLCSFFSGYKQEILKHFHYEEQVVFPYVYQLVDGLEPSAYHINQYEEHHDNIDDKLSDLKSIIIKYLPDDESESERSEILSDLFLFEDDLLKHTRIEESILTPLVRELEECYGR